MTSYPDVWHEGIEALKQERYADAVRSLEAACAQVEPNSKDYFQGQMWLVRAYQQNGQLPQAIALCQQMAASPHPQVQAWAQRVLPQLHADRAQPSDAPYPAPDATTPLTPPQPPASEEVTQVTSRLERRSPTRHDAGSPGKKPKQPDPQPETDPIGSVPKAGRSPQHWVKLGMKGVAANLAWASSVTLGLLVGMVFALTLGVVLISGSKNPTLGLAIAVLVTLGWNTLVFFLAPLIMDLSLRWFGSTRWTAITEIDRISPETGRILREVCKKKNIPEPRLGIIEDDNPTAFTYGSLPSNARLVVSRGLFKYLDDDEIATVYAHELGHIVHWDFAIMTLASTLLQIAYLIYVYIERIARNLGDGEIGERAQQGAKVLALVAYFVYLLGTYLVQYLSRTREYYADHFAAEVTGNPNGLSRALVKIAYGILEVGERDHQASPMLQSTRAIGIADSKVAGFTGSAYRVASDPILVGRAFLWDLFNPWAWWMELNSTHPLTGKRVRALSTYAEQLGLPTEFEMAKVIREGRSLNKQRLYGDFVIDVVVFWADWLLGGLGLAIGLGIFAATQQIKPGIALPLLGFGVGTLIKTFFMYPDFNRAPETDVLHLMSDPYASPLRGRPVKLAGSIIGRGDSGYRFGSDLQLQDPTGMIYLYYSSRFGPLGNFLFGMTQAESFVGQEVRVRGWFRRGVMPIVDLIYLDCDAKWTVNSYHRFWKLALGLGAIALAFVLPGWIEAILLIPPPADPSLFVPPS